MPARKGPSEDETPDIDALLAADDDAVADAILATQPEVQTESAEQRRIRELEAELSKPMPEKKAARPTPESQLSPDQRRIRELEDQLARRQTVIAENAETEYATKGTGETILFHCVEDGLIFQGQVWQKGQECEFEVGSEAYQQTFDRNGKTWLDLVDDEDGQYRRWGKRYLRPGPYRGKKWTADVSGITNVDDLRAIQEQVEAERRRGRAAPIMRY